MSSRISGSRVLSKSEQLALLKQPNPRAPTGLRNLCIISLMLKTGIKISEVIKLYESDLDWDNGTVHINESGGAKERTIAVGISDLNLLRSWRRIRPDGCSCFFTTLRGGKLKDRYLREMIKRYARRAGIAKDVYPHMLRTTFAVDFIHETRNLDLLQEVLGHRDQNTTQNYIKIYFLEQSGIIESAGSVFNVNEDAIQRVDNFKPDTEHKHPYITIEAVAEPGDRQSIPAMKCCNCDFILHYQGNCPQCGASFYSILKHWGKTL